MIRSSLLLFWGAVCCIASAATSEPIRIDLRSQIQVVESGTVQFPCNPLWMDGADSVEVTAIDAEGRATVLTNAAADAIVCWMPTNPGCYQVCQTFYREGHEVGATLAARYVLPSSATAESLTTLDICEGSRVVSATQKINYDAGWHGDASDTISISLNGNLWKSASGSGMFEWVPISVGHYAFIYSTGRSSVLSAGFDVLGPTLNIMTSDQVEQGMLVRIEGGDGWTIYYTLDGSDPDTSSLCYANPFVLERPKKIRAVAYSSNGIRSATFEREYLFDIPYRVSFDANCGSGTMEGLAMVYGQPHSLPTNRFVRSGYNFVGWATNETGVVVFTDGQTVSNLLAVANSEMAFIAQWEPVDDPIPAPDPSVTVLFYNFSGAVSVSSMQFDIGNPYGSLPSAFCETGWFAGWFTENEGGVLMTGFSNATESVTALYAHWTNDVVTSTMLTNRVELTNTVVSTVYETNTVTETLYQTNTVEKTETVFVTNVIEQVHEVEVEKIVTVEKVETLFETNYVDVVVTNYVGVGDGEVGKVSDEVMAFEPSSGFDGSQKRTLNGIVFDDDGVFCGLAQIATAKATKNGVKVGGFLMLDDGKKQTLKSATGVIDGEFLTARTKVGKIGEIGLVIGANGFRGQMGDLTVVSATPDDTSGVLKGAITLSYFDPKTSKLKTKSIKVSGVALEGDASGIIDVRGKEPKSFAAEIE